MKFNRNLMSVTALGILLAVSGCAHRGDGDHGMAGMDHGQKAGDHGGMAGHDMGRGGMMGRHAGMAEHMEGHLAFLKTELKITKAQEPRWNTYATAMRDHAKMMGDMQRSMMSQRRPAPASLPDRLNQAESMMTMHRAEMRKMADATKPLYASLSPAQRRTGDELLGDMMGGHEMGGPGMMRGRPMMEMRGQRQGGDRVEGRIAFLKTELKITPAQEPQWNSFAAELRAQSRAMGRMHAGMMGKQSHGAGNLAARMDAEDKMMAGHIDAVRKFKGVATALYATLSPDQKVAADRLLGGRGPRMGRMMPMG